MSRAREEVRGRVLSWSCDDEPGRPTLVEVEVEIGTDPQVTCLAYAHEPLSTWFMANTDVVAEARVRDEGVAVAAYRVMGLYAPGVEVNESPPLVTWVRETRIVMVIDGAEVQAEYDVCSLCGVHFIDDPAATVDWKGRHVAFHVRWHSRQ